MVGDMVQALLGLLAPPHLRLQLPRVTLDGGQRLRLASLQVLVGLDIRCRTEPLGNPPGLVPHR